MKHPIDDSIEIDRRVFGSYEKKRYFEPGFRRLHHILYVRRMRHHRFKGMIASFVQRRITPVTHDLLSLSRYPFRRPGKLASNFIGIEIFAESMHWRTSRSVSVDLPEPLGPAITVRMGMKSGYGMAFSAVRYTVNRMIFKKFLAEFGKITGRGVRRYDPVTFDSSDRFAGGNARGDFGANLSLHGGKGRQDVRKWGSLLYHGPGGIAQS